MAPSFLTTALLASEPVIESVSAPVCKQGGEVTLRLVGEGFNGCQGLVFYSPKIRCTAFEVDSDFEMSAKIKTDQDCPIKNQPFRLISKFGFSDLRTIRVTPFPVVAAESTGTTRVPNTNGLTYCGVLESGDIDRYEIELKKGERLSVEVEAVRLGGGLLDTVLKVYDPRGELLARVDDDPLFQQDPVASIVATESGKYLVEVNETNYSGTTDSHYALHIGQFPRPSVVFPAGGQFGQLLALNMIDTDGLLQTHKVRLPKTMPSEGFRLQLASTGGNRIPTPLPFRLSELESVQESEPNDSPAEAGSAVNSPVAWDGIIEFPGDTDWFRFRINPKSAASRRVRIEVFADRIGSPVDTLLELYDAEECLVAVNDDWGSHDSRIEFTPNENAEYFVSVSDKLGGGTRNSVYRIEVSICEPRITAFLPRPDRASQDDQVVSIPQGNRIVKRVGVKREYVEGEVTLQFQNLPPGVFASPSVIPEDQYWVPAILQASPDARLGGELSQINPTSSHGNAVVSGHFEQTIDLVHSTADQLFRSTTVDRFPVAVTPAVPFDIEIVPFETELPAGGTMQLKVQINRSAGFDEPIRVTLPFLPPWVVSESRIVVPKGKTEGVFNLEARTQARSQLWNLVAEAEVDLRSAEGDVTDLDGRRVASELTPLRIAETPVNGQFETLAGSPGKMIRARCRLEASAAFKGSFTASLEGLPAKITAEPVELSGNDRMVEFAIQLSADAPVGNFDQLQVRLTSNENGQRVGYVVAKQTKLIVQEPEKLMRDPDGRLLSPLEVLRKASNAR